jgi:hypothetical protein
LSIYLTPLCFYLLFDIFAVFVFRPLAFLIFISLLCNGSFDT